MEESWHPKRKGGEVVEGSLKVSKDAVFRTLVLPIRQTFVGDRHARPHADSGTTVRQTLESLANVSQDILRAMIFELTTPALISWEPRFQSLSVRRRACVYHHSEL
jgi:phage baseplate assembly protein W